MSHNARLLVALLIFGLALAALIGVSREPFAVLCVAVMVAAVGLAPT